METVTVNNIIKYYHVIKSVEQMLINAGVTTHSFGARHLANNNPNTYNVMFYNIMSTTTSTASARYKPNPRIMSVMTSYVRIADNISQISYSPRLMFVSYAFSVDENNVTEHIF